MSLRDLVAGPGGGGSCAVPDERASSTNPLGRLADAVLGDRKGRHPEHVGPRGAGPGSAGSGAFADQFLSEQRLRGNLLGGDDAGFSALPGQYRGTPGGPREGGWAAEFQQQRGAPEGYLSRAPRDLGAPPPMTPPVAPEHPALTAALHSAVADPSIAPASASTPPPRDLTLTPREKTVIRNRSAIMARHVHGMAPEHALRARLGAALSPLSIDPTPEGAMDGPRQFTMGGHPNGPALADASADSRAGWVHEFRRGENDQVQQPRFQHERPLHHQHAQQQQQQQQQRGARWADDFAAMSLAGGARDAGSNAVQWTEEYSGRRASPRVDEVGGEIAPAAADGGPDATADAWAEEFNAAMPDGEWAREFRREQDERDQGRTAGAERAHAPTEAQAETAAHAGRIAETMSSDQNPKFQNSQFLKFMSRMSRGETVVEGNDVVEVTPGGGVAAGERWGEEFARARGGGDWAAEFAAAGGPAADWARQFQRNQSSVAQRGRDPAQGWADEFADVPEEWAAEFEEMKRGNPDWALENVWDQIESEGAALRNAERSHYQFTDPNPYLGRKDALEVGRDLFRRGVLSEAALALEAAVRADPKLVEGWRLLGTVHAENDDDRKAIAAMTKANEADPNNLEVLLSLGVSHTNELDQDEAVGHMRAWLRNQPRFRALEAEHASALGPGGVDTPASVLELFKRAASAAPRDADVHAVLGVLAHLCRDYDAAVDAFNRALDIAPHDYSMWNKLGATQANSARSADAMAAYQRALDLKPNYVRAWCNMGIAFANQGKYADSVAYYVRALSLNPQAESAWGYLRISLGCCGRIELMEAVDRKDLELLQREFPL